MESIKHIFPPKLWKVILEKENDLLEGDYIYQILIGYSIDESKYSGIFEYISKETYYNLKYGNYSFKAFPYSKTKIIIFDKNNNVIPLIKGQANDYYTDSQKEFVRKIKRINE